MSQPLSAETVSALVRSVMESRRYKAFRLLKVDFAFFPSAYNLLMEWEGKQVTTKIPSELIHDAASGKDLFMKRKIKRFIKDALGVKNDNDE